MTILYVVLVSVFLGWGFFHRKRKRSPVSRTKPLINIPNGGVIRRINSQKDENVPMQVMICLICYWYFSFYLWLFSLVLPSLTFEAAWLQLKNYLNTYCLFQWKHLIKSIYNFHNYRCLRMFLKLIVEYSFRLCKATCQSSTGDLSFESTAAWTAENNIFIWK